MSNYFLMNKNDKLLEFQTTPGLGSTNAREVTSFSKLRPVGFSDIQTWLEQRNYAKHKEHFRKWLKEWGIDTLDGFLNITHCLGINDCLWVKPVESVLTWENVNLYANAFNDVAAHTAFESGLYGLQLSSTSPEFTSDGSFPKCWVRQGTTINLYKAGGTGAVNVGLEPYSEYMSSYVADTLSLYLSATTTVTYDLLLFKKHLCSSCILFTDESVGFVPFSRIAKPGYKYNIDNVLDACDSLGFLQQAEEMLLIDSIIMNQDRHLGNFGFLVNNDTFQITGFAPLFDYNISMLCNALETDLDNYSDYFDEYRVGHKLGGTFDSVGNELYRRLGVTLPSSLALIQHPELQMNITRFDKVFNVFRSNYSKITK